MSNQTFPKLLPVRIGFLHGESASPEKMTAIFNYMQSAFYVLENFLGNGVDYRVDESDRKMLFNISGALGQMGKLYKPISKIMSLNNIYANFGRHSSSLASIADTAVATDGETCLVVTKELNIPFNFTADDTYQFGIDTDGIGKVIIHYSTGTTTEIIIAPKVIGPYSLQLSSKTTINAGSAISYISIEPTSGYAIRVYGLYLVNAADGKVAFSRRAMNMAYAVDRDNDILWKVMKPCKLAMNGTCPKRTGQYCIGNIYDIDVRTSGWTAKGEPVCAGKYSAAVLTELVPRDGSNNILEYVEDDTPASDKMYTIQSPLLMKSMPFAIKWSPFAVHDLPAGEIISRNKVIIYNTMAGGGTSNPMMYDMAVNSGGRPDIVFVIDDKDQLAPSVDRVQVLLAEYGITEMLYDVLSYMAEKEQPRAAVYAD